MSWDQYSARDPYYYGHKSQADKDAELLELRRRASANLTKIYAGEFRKTEPKKPRRPEVTADDIQQGHMVLEYRELLKIEQRYARRKNLSADETANWEEVDARLDTLREAFKNCTRQEMTRWVRIYRKTLKGTQ